MNNNLIICVVLIWATQIPAVWLAVKTAMNTDKEHDMLVFRILFFIGLLAFTPILALKKYVHFGLFPADFQKATCENCEWVQLKDKTIRCKKCGDKCPF